MNILDELVAKGVAGDVIVAVAKLIADAEQTERIRAAARERMRAVRERSRTHANGSEQGISPSLLSNLPSSEDRKQEERSEIVALANEFAVFWSAYPHKVGKRAAATAFERAHRRASMETIMTGLARYAAKTDDRPWCNPATWLNQDRWEDQLGPSQEGNRPGAQPALGEAERAAMLEEFHRVQLNRRADNGQGQGTTQKPRPSNVAELRPNGPAVRQA